MAHVSLPKSTDRSPGDSCLNPPGVELGVGTVIAQAYSPDLKSCQ